jgi:hypothetical protein
MATWPLPRVDRRAPVTFLSLFLTAILLIGCTQGLHRIYTTASFTTLPPEGARVLVWADDPTVRGTLVAWFERRGLTVVSASMADHLEARCLECRRQAALQEGHSVGVHQVIVAGSSPEDQREELRVSIESLGLQPEAHLWTATASARVSGHLSPEQRERQLVELTCHALATAWRYRPAGYPMHVSLDYCHFQL